MIWLRRLALLTTFALLPPAIHAQTGVPLPTLTARFTELLQRASSGHSPAPEEIKALNNESVPPSLQDVSDALPLILKALDSSDTPVRTYALVALDSLRASPDVPAAASNATATHGPAPQPGPATYKSDIAAVLAPAIAKIATHLKEESAENRVSTALILGGFTPNPPAALYPPMLAFLKRDDAIASVGLQVVQDLVGVGPIPDNVAAALVAYTRRTDQTASSQADLVDAFVSAPNQSRILNASLLELLYSDDQSLRARLILSLPQLDLSADSFAETHGRVQQLAANEQENLQVVTAAKAVATCWTQPRMTTPCPKYDSGSAPPVPAPLPLS